MANITKSLRNIRYKIQPGATAHLVVETTAGKQYGLKILDVSINGLGTVSQEAVDTDNGLEVSALLPYSKLILENQEVSLGRLVVRRIESQEKGSFVALSLVDGRVPVFDALSKCLEQNIKDRKDPFSYELSPSKFNVGSFKELENDNNDLFFRTKQFEVYFDEWKSSAKYQHHNIRLPSHGPRVNLTRSRTNNRNDFLVMGSNDYLGLSSHPEVLEAAKTAIDQYGFGSTGSPLTTGITEIHEELTALLARIFKKESAILFNSGYAANIGTIAGLTRETDLILADFYSHASLQDGLKMSSATSKLFKHNDVNHLERLLKEFRDQYSGALLVTEGVFSMDGDVPALKEILDLANKYNARVMLDEAHSFGVIGNNGLGCWETCPNQNVDIIMGTFSKICGGIGGFIAADKEVVKWLTWHARSHIFSVSIPPSTAAAALAAIKLFLRKPEIKDQLKRNIAHFIEGLLHIGWPIEPDHQSAVIPLIIGDEEKLGIMNQVFRDQGVYVIPVIYPAVSKKQSRFRFTIMANHTISDLDYALLVIEKALRAANVGLGLDTASVFHRPVPIEIGLVMRSGSASEYSDKVCKSAGHL